MQTLMIICFIHVQLGVYCVMKMEFQLCGEKVN